MYQKYHASLGAIVWSDIKYGIRLFGKALPDLIAGIAFGAIIVALPILAGFIAG